MKRSGGDIMDVLMYLSELVSINSVFPNECSLAEYLEQKLEEFGFDVERQYVGRRRYNVIAKRGNPNVAFYGHMDTVPLYGKWSADPFELKEKNGRLYGLGSADMKGGIAAILSSFQKTKKDVMGIFCVDEENISLGANECIKKHSFEKIKLLISAEPNDSPIQKPNTVLLGRRGRIVLRVEFTGKSAHGASFKKSNITSGLRRFLEYFEKYSCRLNRKKTTIGTPNAFISAINCEATSLSIPEKAVIDIDRHFVLGENRKTILEEVAGIVKKSGLNFSVAVKERETPYSDYFITDKSNKYVKMLANEVSAAYGDVNYSYGRSVADDNVFSRVVNVVGFGPVGGNIHSSDEFVDKKSLLNVERVYTNLIKNL